MLAWLAQLHDRLFEAAWLPADELITFSSQSDVLLDAKHR